MALVPLLPTITGALGVAMRFRGLGYATLGSMYMSSNYAQWRAYRKRYGVRAHPSKSLMQLYRGTNVVTPQLFSPRGVRY